MSRFYAFPIVGLDAAQKCTLVCFCTQSIEVDELIDELRKYCDQYTPPDRILLIYPEVIQKNISEVIAMPRFQSRLPGVSRYIDEPIVDKLPFSVEGLQASSSSRVARIIQEGLVGLFNKHKGLISGSNSFHFVKPSGKHCNAFLRTANVLVRGSEIEFLAACCLSACPADMTRVYTDTGAIHSIAYAILRLFAAFADKRSECVIDSFGSYSSLSRFSFVDAARALVLISASTSGALRSEVISKEPRLKSQSVLTLFYLGEGIVGQNALCDLNFDAKTNVDGLEKLKSYAEDKCPLCACSIPIRMTEEQFIPQGPHVEEIQIKASDFSAKANSFFNHFAGKDVFRAHYRETSAVSGSGEIYLDLVPLFSRDFLGLEEVKDRFNRFASHLVSANTKRIIHLNDQASNHLAGRLALFARENGLTVNIHPARELNERGKVPNQIGGTTIVVASAVSTGRSLTEVSKSLRHLQTGGAIKYAVAFNRPRNEDVAKDTRSHLVYGENKPQEHGFEFIYELYLPSWRPERKTAWEIEFESLAEDLIVGAVELESRKEVIRLSQSDKKRGLSNELFLPTISGDTLTLRPKFAFWQFDYSSRQISQADVYATIVSVLHNLRESKKHSEHSLSQTGLARKVLSPRCFERFNDGIIQACLLRAAFKSELDYSLRDDLSEYMKDVVITILEHADSSVGEASLEFLLAIATRQLQLVPSHVAAIYDDYSLYRRNPFWEFLFKAIRSTYEID